MDIESVFRTSHTVERETKYLWLSYGNYERLTDSQKKVFNMTKSSYEPIVNKLVLLMARRTKDLKKSYWRKAQKLIKLGILSKYDSCISYREDRLIKELTFLGWVPENQLRMRSKYGYFKVNRKLNGIIYVYPVGYSDHFISKDKAESYLDALDNLYHGCPPGYVRYEYSKLLIRN